MRTKEGRTKEKQMLLKGIEKLEQEKVIKFRDYLAQQETTPRGKDLLRNAYHDPVSASVARGMQNSIEQEKVIELVNELPEAEPAPRLLYGVIAGCLFFAMMLLIFGN